MAQVPASVIAASAAKSLRQDQMLTRLARQFQTTREQVKARLTELRNSTRPSRFAQAQDASQNTNQIDFSAFDIKETELLELILTEPALADIAIERVSPEQFAFGPLKEIFETIGEFFHDGREASYESVMLHVDDPVLKNVVEYLLDEATKKQAAAKANNTGIELAVHAQLDTVIEAFNRQQIQSAEQAKISQLQQPALKADEEAMALEELLRQTRQRQGLTAPTDG